MASSGSFPHIPFPIDTAYEVASGASLPAGLVLGNVYVDKSGKLYAFYQIDPALTNNTFANNEVAVLKASWVVTNDVSDGADATYPIAAGVARGSLAESTSGGTTRYGLFQVWGRGNVKNDGTDITIGERLNASASADGAAVRVTMASTSADGALTVTKVGVAAETQTGTTVDAFISCGLLFQ